MFCLNCFHENTQVVNSRSHKKQPAVWRRRKCPTCATVFTTYERPSLLDNKKIDLPGGQTAVFNLGKLILSIARAFAHNPKDGEHNSLWLAMSVEDTLSIEREAITPEDIAAITHDVLKNYDQSAAMQYAVQHQLIVSTRRRGRPSLVWHGPPKRESPSR